MNQTPPHHTSVFLVANLLLILLLAGCAKGAGHPAPAAGAPVEMTFNYEGTTYQVIEGNLYKTGAAPGRLEFVDALYDKDFFAKNYTVVDGVTYRKAPGTGKLYPTHRSFHEDFETANAIGDLIRENRLWTEMTLQSRRTPTVSDYVKLRKRILAGESDFLDNIVTPSAEVVHTGKTALKTYCEPPTAKMICSKASLSMQLLYFAKGDNVWYSGWYYLKEGGKPYTLLDLECTWIKEHPGIRIALLDGGNLGWDMKSPTRPYYRQPRGKEIPMPVGRWVHVEAHLRLSEKEDGLAELWQDGVKIVEATGMTLPLPSAIYDSLEIGISALNRGQRAATLYVDDLDISDRPLSKSQ